MKITETDQLNKLNQITKKGGFLDVRKLVVKNWLNIIISKKNTGKSTSAMAMGLNDYTFRNKHTAFIRNTKEELETSGVVQSYNNLLYKAKKWKEYSVKPSGIYWKPDPDKDFEKQVSKFLYMSRPLNSASQNALECEFILYDEIINPTFTLKNFYTQFCLLCDTLQRRKLATIVCLGNKHETDNDIISGAGLEVDWESNENQVCINPNTKSILYWVGDYKVKAMDSVDEQKAARAYYNNSLRAFNNGGVATSQNRNVYKWELNDIERNFSPLWKITLQGAIGIFGTYKHANGQQYLYCKEQTHASEFAKLVNYCLFPYDKESYNVFLDKDNAMDIVEIFLDYFNRGYMLYDTAYIKDICRMMLPYLKNLV